MFQSFHSRLDRLLAQGGPRLFQGGLKGIEKESLRVAPSGCIAQTPHPKALGSALTHPSITTDYSEALLEFITAPYADIRDTLTRLCDIHTFAYQNIGDELLWATSMPCVIGGPKSIPIAEYGSSNVARMKHIYRIGLDYRYGRLMQAISGVHFNYSLPPAVWPLLKELEGDQGDAQSFQSAGYFRLIRNFQRFGWIVPYLFGASPAICKSFLEGRPHEFESFDRGTLYAPYATSLRMSDIGYKNRAQAGLKVSYDGVDAYVADLSRAIATPDAEYTALGVQVNGEYRQLNGNILQIENEYYSFIRPKNIAERGERPTLALQRRGVRYVEMRALDVNAFAPIGVCEQALRFVEALLVFCLLEDSPPVNETEQREIDYNQAQVARRGRDPQLMLRRRGEELPLKQWALGLWEALIPVAAALDAGDPAKPYLHALKTQQPAIMDPEATPSAAVLAQMRENGESFTAFALRLSRQHEKYFKERTLPAEKLEGFRELARRSLEEQAALEAGDTVSFEDYLAAYFA